MPPPCEDGRWATRYGNVLSQAMSVKSRILHIVDQLSMALDSQKTIFVHTVCPSL